MTKDDKQNIKLKKVDDKAAYENLLIKYAELENKIADIKANCDLAIEGRDIKIKELEQQIEKMKNWCNCGNYQDCLFQRAEEGKGLKAEECHNCDKWEIEK